MRLPATVLPSNCRRNNVASKRIRRPTRVTGSSCACLRIQLSETPSIDAASRTVSKALSPGNKATLLLLVRVSGEKLSGRGGQGSGASNFERAVVTSSGRKGLLVSRLVARHEFAVSIHYVAYTHAASPTFALLLARCHQNVLVGLRSSSGGLFAHARGPVWANLHPCVPACTMQGSKQDKKPSIVVGGCHGPTPLVDVRSLVILFILHISTILIYCTTARLIFGQIF